MVEHQVARQRAHTDKHEDGNESTPVKTPAPAAPVPLRTLTVGSATDPAEAAADVLAIRALDRIAAGGDEQAAGGGGQTVERPFARRRLTDGPPATAPLTAEMVGAAGGVAPDAITDQITREARGGRPLDAPVRRRMESGFGRSLASVRVHHDDGAGRLATALSAEAFTVGNHIFFGAGRYQPGSPDGDHVLAHEIAHTTQPSVIHRMTLPWKKKKGQKSDPQSLSISGPTSGHVMTEEEKGGVPDAKSLIEQKESDDEIESLMNLPITETKEKNRGPDDETLAGMVGMFKKAHMEAQESARGPDDDTLSGMVGMFEDAEAEARDWAPDIKPDPGIPDKLKTKMLPAGALFWPLSDAGKVGPEQKVSKDFCFVPSKLSAYQGTFSLVTVSATKKYIVRTSEVIDRERYVSETDPVFPVGDDGKPRVPRPEDVAQGRLGDCYLEAALSSLAHRNPKAIMEMITDFGTNVTVRLHHVSRPDPAKPPVFKPTYVRVAKSRVRRDKELLFDKGALWVGMIEKAYAAGGFGGSLDKTKANESKVATSMGDIAGGGTGFAWEVLVGKPSQMIALSQSDGRADGNSKGLPWSPPERKEYKETAQKPVGGTYSGLISMQVLKDEKKVDQWMSWINAGGFAKIADLYSATYKPADGYKERSIRVEDFEQVFKDNGLAAEIANPMLTYLQAYFPGKRGTGKYSRAQLKAWNDIVTALGDGKLVSASTKKAIARKPTGTGHSGGESKSKGLAGGHAYTVLDTKVDDQGRKFVQMRNPWGKYSREYDFSKTKATGGQARAVDDGDGISWFELDDVTKRFYRIFVQ